MLGLLSNGSAVFAVDSDGDTLVDAECRVARRVDVVALVRRRTGDDARRLECRIDSGQIVREQNVCCARLQFH